MRLPLALVSLCLLAAPAWAQDAIPKSPPPPKDDEKKKKQEEKPQDEPPSLSFKESMEKKGFGRLSAWVRSRTAVRLNDRTVIDGSATEESDAGDIAQMENTLWAEWTLEKPLKVEWLDLKFIGRAVYDSGFSVNDDIDSEEARDELEFEADLREAYAQLNLGSVMIRAGRQIVVWGEADIFRVNDWVNPLDIRRGFFGDLEESREPLWMLMGRWSGMQWGLEAVWNPGDYQEEMVAPEGAEFYPNEAWAQLRDRTFRDVNAKVRAQLTAMYPPGTPIPNPVIPAANFTYINDEEKPHRQLRNSEAGLRFRYQLGDWDLGLMYFNTLSDRPVLETRSAVFNPVDPPPFGPLTAANNTMTITTEVTYHRLNVVGASFNKDVEMGILRGEIACSIDETFTRLGGLGLEPKERTVLRAVLGFDRPTYIPLLSPDRTVNLSVQVYHQYIHHAEEEELVEVPFRDEIKDHETAFSFIAQFAYLEDRLLPQIVYTRDLKGSQLVTAKVEYKVGNSWRATLAGSFFDGRGDHGFGVFDHRDQISLGLTFVY